MFPLSHTYVSTEVTDDRKSALLIFGSILPDIATTSKGELGRDEIHNAPMKFFDFVKSNHNDLIDLAIGVRLHSHVDRGADFYSDDSEVGYAVIEGRKINSDVARLLNIDAGEASLVLAHNFIEAAVDLNLLDSHPYVLSVYEQGMQNSNLQKITQCLSEYLKKDRELIYEELINLIDFQSPDHLASAEALVDGIGLPLIELRFRKKVNRSDTLAILNKAKSLTKTTYLDFLEGVVENMKLNFAGLVQN